MAQFNVGTARAEYPSIFVLEKYNEGYYIRHTGVYNGTNFYEISEGYKQQIERGELAPYCYEWKCAYANWINPDWYLHSRGYA